MLIAVLLNDELAWIRRLGPRAPRPFGRSRRAAKVRAALDKLDLRYPPADPAVLSLEFD